MTNQKENGKRENRKKLKKGMLKSRLVQRANIPAMKKVEEEVLECIIGQDEQVKKILTAVYRTMYFPSIKANILIIGNSGTGKTATLEQIAKQLHIPYTTEDATKYTQEGYIGANVEEMLYNLYENANHDIRLAQKGMIIIDEIDKKAEVPEQDKTISGVEVFKSLLKIIEGTTIKLKLPKNENTVEIVDFDTSNLIIVCLGSFSDLKKIRDKRLNVSQVGFKKEHVMGKGERAYVKEDLVEYGMIEEFAGRIDTIVEMNILSKEDLVRILKESKLSIFYRYEQELRKRNITLQYDHSLFEQIAEKSFNPKTGARELSNTVNYIFENILYEVFTNPETYSKCKLLSGIVEDNRKYKLS